MNKSDLISKMSAVSGQTKVQSHAALDAAICVMIEALERGESIRISGFGTFESIVRPVRMRHNPKTGEVLEISPSMTVRFRPGNNLKKTIEE